MSLFFTDVETIVDVATVEESTNIKVDCKRYELVNLCDELVNRSDKVVAKARRPCLRLAPPPDAGPAEDLAGARDSWQVTDLHAALPPQALCDLVGL